MSLATYVGVLLNLVLPDRLEDEGGVAAGHEADV